MTTCYNQIKLEHRECSNSIRNYSLVHYTLGSKALLDECRTFFGASLSSHNMDIVSMGTFQYIQTNNIHNNTKFTMGVHSLLGSMCIVSSSDGDSLSRTPV